MARRTRSEITRGYVRLQRRKRDKNAFDGDVLDHSPFNPTGRDWIARALAEVAA